MQTYCRHDAAVILDEIGSIGLDKCMNAIVSEYNLSNRFLMEVGHLLDMHALSDAIPMGINVYNKYIDHLNWAGVTKHIELDIKGIDFIMANVDKITNDIFDRLLEVDNLDCITLSVIINQFMGKNMMTKENWDTVSKYKFLDSVFLRSYHQYLDWCEVSKINKNIPFDLIIAYMDDIHWREIWFNYKFRIDELVTIVNKLMEKGFHVDGGLISSTQVLTEDFMNTYSKILNWTNISEYQKMSYDFLMNHLEEINLFHLDKNCVTPREVIDKFIYHRHTQINDAKWVEF